MDEMIERLEELLLCESVSPDQRDLIERCLEDGYSSLPEDEKSTIRRMLNRSAAALGSTALQRWRERRRQRELDTRAGESRKKASNHGGARR